MDHTITSGVRLLEQVLQPGAQLLSLVAVVLLAYHGMKLSNPKLCAQ